MRGEIKVAPSRLIMAAALALGVALVCQPAMAGLPGEEQEIDGKLKRYWGPRPASEMVKRMYMDREGRHEVSLFGGTIPNDPFHSYGVYGGRYSYSILSSLAVELTFARTVLSDTDLTEFLSGKTSTTDLLKENDRHLMFSHMNLVVSPFYGKWSFLGYKISNLDIHFSIGGGFTQVEYVSKDTRATETAYRPEGNVGFGMQLYFTEWLALRLDLNQYLYSPAQQSRAQPTLLSMGLSTFFPFSSR